MKNAQAVSMHSALKDSFNSRHRISYLATIFSSSSAVIFTLGQDYTKIPAKMRRKGCRTPTAFFPMRKFISSDDSVSAVVKSGMTIAVKIFDRKSVISLRVNSTAYPAGNLSGLFLTA